MPSFKKLTPNLIVASVERSLAFYVDVLGFERGMTVPEQSPLVFASVTSGTVEIFFNDAAVVIKEYPSFGGRPIGATATMFVEIEDGADAARAIDALHERVKARAKIAMPLEDKFYGMREFAIEDPDGYVITFAQRV